MSMPIIGMRNLKTALAVFLCIVVLRLLKFDSPFYACIAAVITMQNTIDVSYKTGLHRMTGTIIGAFFGMVFTLISRNNVSLTALGIVLVIYVTNMLKQKNSTSIACIVFLAIMTNLTGSNPVQYSLFRVIETFIGIIIAVGVNYMLFPPRQDKQENQSTRLTGEQGS